MDQRIPLPRYDDPMVAPRYREIATFMRAPLCHDPVGLDIGLVGVPFDGGTTNRPGARHGPREMRNMSSLMRSIHHVSRVNPYAICKVADLGDVPLPRIFDLEATMADIAAFYRVLHAAGVADSRTGTEGRASVGSTTTMIRRWTRPSRRSRS